MTIEELIHEPGVRDLRRWFDPGCLGLVQARPETRANALLALSLGAVRDGRSVLYVDAGVHPLFVWDGQSRRIAEASGTFQSVVGSDRWVERASGPGGVFQTGIGWFTAGLAEVCDVVHGPTTVIVDGFGDRLPWHDGAWVEAPWLPDGRWPDPVLAGLSGDQVEMIDTVARDMHNLAHRRPDSVTLVLSYHPVVEASLAEYAAYRVVSEIDCRSSPDDAESLWAPELSVYDYDEVTGKWLHRASARTGPSV